MSKYRKTFHTNANRKKPGNEMYISDITLFKNKNCKEGHYIVIKQSIQQQDIMLVSTYAPKHLYIYICIKQILTNIKGEIDSKVIVIGTLMLHLIQ